MYARLVLFKLGAGNRPAAERMIAQFAAAIQKRQGFKGVTFLADDAVGEYGGLIIWESKADAEAAFAALNPALEQALQEAGQGPSMARLFEVIELKS